MILLKIIGLLLLAFLLLALLVWAIFWVKYPEKFRRQSWEKGKQERKGGRDE